MIEPTTTMRLLCLASLWTGLFFATNGHGDDKDRAAAGEDTITQLIEQLGHKGGRSDAGGFDTH